MSVWFKVYDDCSSPKPYVNKLSRCFPPRELLFATASGAAQYNSLKTFFKMLIALAYKKRCTQSADHFV